MRRTLLRAARKIRMEKWKARLQKRINLRVRYKFEQRAAQCSIFSTFDKDRNWYDLVEQKLPLLQTHENVRPPYVYSATTETRQLAWCSCSRISHSGSWIHRNYMEITPTVNYACAIPINISNLLWKYEGISPTRLVISFQVQIRKNRSFFDECESGSRLRRIGILFQVSFEIIAGRDLVAIGLLVLFRRRPTGSHGASPRAHLSCLFK